METINHNLLFVPEWTKGLITIIFNVYFVVTILGVLASVSMCGIQKGLLEYELTKSGLTKPEIKKKLHKYDKFTISMVKDAVLWPFTWYKDKKREFI